MPTYNDDIVIDESALDVEWLDHPRRMLIYCHNAVEAHKEMDLAKESLDFIKAQLDREIRADPQAFGLSPNRMTESAIQAAVRTHDQYIATSQDLVEKKYQYEMANAVVKAFEHRKNALENLVRLHSQSYFAGPVVPHDLSAVRAERDARANRLVRFSRRS